MSIIEEKAQGVQDPDSDHEERPEDWISNQYGTFFIDSRRLADRVYGEIPQKK